VRACLCVPSPVGDAEAFAKVSAGAGGESPG
jgi:hypothetical protein